VDTAGVLEIAVHSVTAVLALWLGLTVATRSGSPPARVFAVIAIAIATWSTSVIVQRLSPSADAVLVGRRVEELMVVLIIPAVAHLSLLIATEAHPTLAQRGLVYAAYVLNILFAIPTLADPTVSQPALVGSGTGEAMFAWAWVAIRLAPLILGAYWLIRAWGQAGGDARRRQLGAALATVAAGALGAAMRVVPGLSDTDAWIGVSLVTLSVVLAAFAVLSAGIFFGSTVAGRAFRTSIAGGVALVALVVALLGLDALGREFTGLEIPLLPLLALVVAVAIYEPLSARLRPMLAAGGRAAARDRLLRILGQPGLTARPAAAGVGPALQRLARALDVDGLSIVRPDGTTLAREGSEPSPGTTVRPIPLLTDGRVMGELRVGATTSGLPLSEHDEELLRLSTAYVAAALRTQIHEDQQAASLEGLAAERAAVDAQASDLHAALVQHADVPRPLRVFALGPLRVDRGGAPVERWGGNKAGNRQAQGLFAFLFDRAERGVSKEEVLELIWPDTDLEKADLAFHRTMVGLRQTLDPGASGRAGRVIRFHNDRYRLEPGVVGWSDVEAFLSCLAGARAAPSAEERIATLEEARAMYRGDYLDDCPFYGDSVHVEERRTLLRGRWVDVLLSLGEAYEQLGDRASAGAAFREAAAASPEGCPPAQAGIKRLGF
jgi:DNA-binding SARP family transcriptional activator